MNSLERFCFFCGLCVLFQGLMPSTGIGLRQHTCKRAIVAALFLGDCWSCLLFLSPAGEQSISRST